MQFEYENREFDPFPRPFVQIIELPQFYRSSAAKPNLRATRIRIISPNEIFRSRLRLLLPRLLSWRLEKFFLARLSGKSSSLV